MWRDHDHAPRAGCGAERNERSLCVTEGSEQKRPSWHTHPSDTCVPSRPWGSFRVTVTRSHGRSRALHVRIFPVLLSSSRPLYKKNCPDGGGRIYIEGSDRITTLRKHTVSIFGQGKTSVCMDPTRIVYTWNITSVTGQGADPEPPLLSMMRERMARSRYAVVHPMHMFARRSRPSDCSDPLEP